MAGSSSSARDLIEGGQAILGIELGSTRIKAVLIDCMGSPIASGSHEWENSLVDGHWTYGDEEIWEGLASCYAALKSDVRERYGVRLTHLRAIGRLRDDAWIPCL